MKWLSYRNVVAQSFVNHFQSVIISIAIIYLLDWMDFIKDFFSFRSVTLNFRQSFIFLLCIIFTLNHKMLLLDEYTKHVTHFTKIMAEPFQFTSKVETINYRLLHFATVKHHWLCLL